MKSFVYLILLAAIYYTIKELLGLHGIVGGIIGGAIAGAIVALIVWGYEKIRSRKQMNCNGTETQNEYAAVNGNNYYDVFRDDDTIGRIDPPGFKQTYDRIIVGILTNITSNQADLHNFGNMLYSNNFYPISQHTKKEILQHINSVVAHVASISNDCNNIRLKAKPYIEPLFNAFISVMAIHEEATRRIEEIENQGYVD